MDDQIIELTKAFVKERLLHEATGHDYYHALRVYNSAVELALLNGNEDQLLIIKLAALLHDVADHKFGYSDYDRKEIISEFLTSLKIKKDIIDEVILIVNNISYSKGVAAGYELTIAGLIVQDADRLDAIGAVGIARSFAYGGSLKRPIYHPHDDVNNNDTISHFYDKLLLLKDTMNTKPAQELAQKRHDFMVEFLEEFYLEWSGDR